MTYGVYAALLTALCNFEYVDLLHTVRASVEFICWTRLPGQVFEDLADARDLSSLLVAWTTGLGFHADRGVEWQLKRKYIALFTLLRDLALRPSQTESPRSSVPCGAVIKKEENTQLQTQIEK
jgi:hypothetical protein